MKKITVEGIQINFNDLTEQKQIELYQKNKKKYKQDAMNSIYISVRIAVVKDEKESSEVLNEMLRTAVKDELYGDVEQAIFNNTIFMAEEETMNLLATSDLWHYRMKAAELSKDSKFLNEMLRKEISDRLDRDVEGAIFNSEFFEIEEETIKQLALSIMYRHRQKAAELSKDSKFLNEMLRKEVNDGQVDDVEQAIFNNEFFELEEETVKQLASQEGEYYRQKAAELSKDSKFLNEMLRKEVNDEQDDDVEYAIFNNGFFEIEEETAKQLASQDDSYYRKIAAELSKDSNMLLEMFVSEMQADEVDEDVLKIIIKNDAFIFEKKALLEYIQNNY